MSVDRAILRAQQLVLRKAMNPILGGIAAKVLAHASDIPEATLRSYCREDAPAAMSLSAFCRLCGVIGEADLSAMLPEGFALVRVHETDEHDDFAADCLEYVSELGRARHPASPAGADLAPSEVATLSEKRSGIIREPDEGTS